MPIPLITVECNERRSLIPDVSVTRSRKCQFPRMVRLNALSCCRGHEIRGPCESSTRTCMRSRIESMQRCDVHVEWKGNDAHDPLEWNLDQVKQERGSTYALRIVRSVLFAAESRQLAVAHFHLARITRLVTKFSRFLRIDNARIYSCLQILFAKSILHCMYVLYAYYDCDVVEDAISPSVSLM